MELSSFVRVFFLCTIVTVSESSHIVYRILDHSEVKELRSPLTFIRCSTEIVDEVAPLPADDIIAMADMVSGDKTIVDVFNIPDSHRDKTNLEECQWCAYHEIRCADNALYDGKYLCVKRTVENNFAKPGDCQKHIVVIEGYSEDEAKRLRDSKIEEPEDINHVGNAYHNDIPQAVDVDFPSDVSHNRLQRSPSANCSVPPPMKTAYVSCTFHPTHTECHQRCFSGYTLEEGTEAMYECSKKERVWRPREFQECERLGVNESLTGQES